MSQHKLKIEIQPADENPDIGIIILTIYKKCKEVFVETISYNSGTPIIDETETSRMFATPHKNYSSGDVFCIDERILDLASLEDFVDALRYGIFQKDCNRVDIYFMLGIFVSYIKQSDDEHIMKFVKSDFLIKTHPSEICCSFCLSIDEVRQFGDEFYKILEFATSYRENWKMGAINYIRPIDKK
jgi:hypothetical protein